MPAMDGPLHAGSSGRASCGLTPVAHNARLQALHRFILVYISELMDMLLLLTWRNLILMDRMNLGMYQPLGFSSLLLFKPHILMGGRVKNRSRV